MTDIKKLKEDKKKIIAELHTTMDAFEPERQSMMKKVDNIQDKFLTIWEQYTNQKTSEQEFLEVSKNFARILESHREMVDRIRRALHPISNKFEKICNTLENLEKKDD